MSMDLPPTVCGKSRLRIFQASKAADSRKPRSPRWAMAVGLFCGKSESRYGDTKLDDGEERNRLWHVSREYSEVYLPGRRGSNRSARWNS